MVTSPFHFGVSLQGIPFEDTRLTVKLASGITAADIGKAMSKSSTTANTFKLAADGDYIVGRLLSVENRTVEGILVGTIEFRFANTLPIKSGETVVAGDFVIGAGSGEVKASALVAAETTANGTDASSTQALANALKVKVNELVAVQAARDNMVVEVSGANAIVLKI